MRSLDIQRLYEEFDKGEEGLAYIANEITDAFLTTKQGYIDELARVWDEVIHFYEGDQHIEYNNTIKSYQPRPVTKYNQHIPRPVVNLTQPIINTIVSVITKNRPQCEVVENSDRSEDINRAKIAESLVNAKWEEDTEQLNYTVAAKIAVMLGTVYRKDYWDTTRLEEVRIPKKFLEEKEDKKGKKDKKAEDKLESDTYKKLSKADNSNEEEDFDSVKLGDTAVRILTPFQVVPDVMNAISSLDEGNYVMEGNVHPLTWIHSAFASKDKGYTSLAEKVKEDTEISVVLDYLQRLKVTSGKGQEESPKADNSAVVIEAYIKPTEKHKKGLMAIVCNRKVLFIDDCPYTHSNGSSWHPYSMYKWDINPFRHHGHGVGEFLVPLQRRLNALESLIILNRMTMASPQWLIPKGVLGPNQYINGAPGLQIEYNAGLNVKPEKVQGISLDASVYKEREDTIMQMHMIAGDNEVLAGKQPSGVGTATALNILLEQSYSKFSVNMYSWEKFIEVSQSKKLNNIRMRYKEPRPLLINRIKAMNLASKQVEIDDYFTGEMLGDNLDVRVEGGSSLPKSKVVEQYMLQNLYGMGLFGDLSPMGNPLGNKEMLRKFGIKQFPSQTDMHIERAQWENNLLRQKKFDEAVPMPTDNALLHWLIIAEEMNRPEFYITNDENVIEGYMRHALRHFIDMDNNQKQTAGITMQQNTQLMTVAQAMRLVPMVPETQPMPMQPGMGTTAGMTPAGVAAPTSPSGGAGGGQNIMSPFMNGPGMQEPPVMA